MNPTKQALDLYHIISRRRSIRSYSEAPIPDAVLNRVLAAAVHSPSGKNRQNWRFIVLRGQARDEYLKVNSKSWDAIKGILQQRLKPSLYAFTERFFYTLGGAPVVILCYSQNTEDEKHLTSVGSVYMAVENLNLAAVAEGLGCCTMGAPLEIQDEVNRFSGVDRLPEFQRGELQLLCAVTLGYPAHQPPLAPRQIAGRIFEMSQPGEVRALSLPEDALSLFRQAQASDK
jgi:hypothetical protein